MHICHVFATFAPGGPQVRMAQVINALAHEHRFTILAMDGVHSAASRLSRDVDVTFLESDAGRWGHAYPLYLNRKLRGLDADLVVTHNWGSLDVAIGAPVGPPRAWLHMETGFEADEARAPKRRRSLARRLLLPRASGVIVPSMHLFDLAREKWGVPTKKLLRIDNGVDTAHYRADPKRGLALRQRLGIPPHAPVVGTVSHLRPVKNPLRLVVEFATWAANFDAHLVFVGDGEMAPQIIRTAADLGVQQRVHLVGHHDDTRDYHCMLDIFALSSMSEQSPVSVLEAMACSRPIISTDVGEVGTHVAELNRPYIVPLEGEHYGKALRALLADRSLRERLGNANRVRVEAVFSLSAMVSAYARAYRQAARTRHQHTTRAGVRA